MAGVDWLERIGSARGSGADGPGVPTLGRLGFWPPLLGFGPNDAGTLADTY